MTRLLVVALSAAVLFAGLAASASAADAALAATQVADRTRAAGAVVIDVIRTNRTHAPVEVVVPNGRDSAELYYSIAATTVGGGALKRTAYGRTLAGTGDGVIAGSLRTVTLAPGESVSVRCRLDRIFVFPRTGRYVVTVREPGEDGDATATRVTVAR